MADYSNKPSRAEQLLKEAFASGNGQRSKNGSRKHPTINILIVLFLLASFAGSILFMLGEHHTAPDFSISNSPNSTIIGSGGQITINNSKPVRQWNELSYDEKTVIKEEALSRFPEIKNIGQGVNWKPIAKWLAEEKGVAHANPRDIFRDNR